MNDCTMPSGAIFRERYLIEGLLGSGGFGNTYRVQDLITKKQAALKEIRPQSYESKEAEILKAIKGIPNIVQYIDSFKENQTEYIVMDVVEGISLREYLKHNGGKMSAGKCLPLFEGLIYSLGRIHELGFIHRDISPGNIMMTEDGKPVLIDFGSATALDMENPLFNPQIFNHKGFEAPENRCPHLYGPWTDIYSLCATLVYIITGEGVPSPNDRQSFDSLPWLLTKGSISQRQQNAILRGMNLDIQMRLKGIRELHSHLYGNGENPEFSSEYDIRYGIKNDGGTRPSNQDRFYFNNLCYPGQPCEYLGKLKCESGRLYLAAVCDGVGGKSYGDVAAETAINIVTDFIINNRSSNVLPEILIDEIADKCNSSIIELSRKKGKTASTMSFLMWKNDHYYAVNIGDSPIFLLRGKRLSRLSTAHTMAEQKKLSGEIISLQDLNTLTSYLGRENITGHEMISISYGRIIPGDTFMICSDGITKAADEKLLSGYLSKTPEKALSSIWKKISKEINRDNSTAIILSFQK